MVKKNDMLTDKDIKWPYESKNWSGPKTVNTPDKYRKWKKASDKMNKPGYGKSPGTDFE